VRRVSWPFATFETEFLGVSLGVVNAGLALWVAAACLSDGDPQPLQYFPVFNPLDIVQLTAIAVIWKWFSRARQEGIVFITDLPQALPFSIVGALGFAWINTAIARSAHTWTGVRYSLDALHHSLAFQSAIAIVGTLLSLGLMMAPARLSSRTAWLTSAVRLGTVVRKLFMVDLSGTRTAARIVSFLAVGLLMLVIGYFSPLPPKQVQDEASC